MLRLIKQVKDIADRVSKIVKAAATASEAVADVARFGHEKKIHRYERDLISRAWADMDEGRIREFEIGDVKIVSAPRSDLATSTDGAAVEDEGEAVSE